MNARRGIIQKSTLAAAARKARRKRKGKCIMTTTKISINTINDVKNFVNIVAKCDYDVDIVSGRYAIDAKSIMGIFSLDLSKELTLNIHSDNCAAFLDEIKSYIVS